MTLSRPLRYLMFALIYFAQGAIASYFAALNPLYLTGEFNLTMSKVGLIGTIAMVPFVLKIFLGMLSDKVNLAGLGYRKPYIIIGLLVQIICLIFVPLINPDQTFWLFALVAFILMTGQALYDTCTDGLALDTTPVSEQGLLQGFMVGGRALGVVIISSLIGILAERVSWASVFYALAIFTAFALPLVFFIKEPERPLERTFQWGAFRAFLKPALISLGLIGALYSFIINGANQIVNPFLMDSFHISLSTAGLLATVWGIGVVVGGLTGGWLTDKIGQRSSLVVAMVTALVAIGALALIPSMGWAWGLVAAFGLAYGYYETVYFALSMRATDPRIAASMYSILMAVANIGTGIGLGVTGVLTDVAGFRWTFAILAALNLLALPLMGKVFSSSKQ